MTIETKFNIGDEVWWYWLGSCAPAKGKILSFRGMDGDIYAHISAGEGLCYIEINRLYTTKEELLKSLWYV